MPKVDPKAYFREIATKAGLDAEKQKQVEELLAHDGFSKAFGDNFKPLPNYSHDLDEVRERTEKEAKAAKDAEYADWFAKEQAKYNEFVSVVDEYKLLKAGTGNGNGTGNGGTPMTQADIDKLVDAKLNASLETILARRDNAYLTFRDADIDHMQRFQKPLDRVAFEKFVKERPERGVDLFSSYKQFIEPEVEKQRTAEIEKRIAAAREEGVRDGYTRRSIPADVQSNTFSPLFDAKTDIAALSEQEQERHSRKAFLEAMAESVKT